MKYMIFEGFGDKEIPIIFPERILHEEMREQVPYAKVISAGYIFLGDDGFVCYGEVKELNTGARQEDARIIAEHFSKTS